MQSDAVDDLGARCPRHAPARRVVSLVPSLTESVARTRRRALVGATDWCSHPADLEVTRVRGTKNPDVARIVSLEPDIVLANKEENRRRDVERLRAAGIPVWVTQIQTVAQAMTSLRRLFEQALLWPAPEWLSAAEAAWRQPAPAARLSVAVAVWRDPWMVVGSNTFTGDLVSRLGLRNVFGQDAARYPRTTPADILAAAPDMIILPDEPYRFTEFDGPDAFPGVPCALVDGRALTWYGPSLGAARSTLTRQVAEARVY
jgi:ABC-type Fe3+-hydroxamate transport system substrate-binding protein